jgi:hypothetical protein
MTQGTGYPPRRIKIPEDCVLSDDEIVKILMLANARKASGDPGFRWAGLS